MEQNYFHSRMAEMGVGSSEKFPKTIAVHNPEAEFPMPSDMELEIFTGDKEGNIDILFTDIYGNLIPYLKYGTGKTASTNAKERHYSIKRIANPIQDESGKSNKYKFPTSDNTSLVEKAQATYPFFAPLLLQRFINKEKIKTLTLTEGAFKAYVACGYDIPCVGLTSITHHSMRDKTIYADVCALIETCCVENIIILWDADCVDISEKDIVNEKPLTDRPLGFYTAVKTIRERLLQKFPKLHVHFAHPYREMYGTKGLDDMLIAAQNANKTAQIASELIGLQERPMYFYLVDITKSAAAVHAYLGLKEVDIFWNRHSQKIGNIEWKYFGDVYRYSEVSESLTLIAPAWANYLHAVGDDFFEERIIPGARNNRTELLARKKSTLSLLYGDDFFKYIRDRYCHGFCCVPDHFNYQKIIEMNSSKFFNKYFPFRWEAQKGEIKHIMILFKHIFGEHDVTHAVTKKKYKGYELGLDYLQILLTNPKQPLPILCQFSPENKTGKSTLTNLIAKIFGDNAILLGNADMQSEFNAPLAGKLVAICEETLLERRKDSEKVKAISTLPQITINPKGQGQYTIDFFTKFIFNSNNRRMIYVNQHDERYWIIQVNRIKERIDYFDDKIEAEIPAFIHFLKERTLATENEDRMHFHLSLIRTQAFQEAVRVNEPTEASNMRIALQEMFLQDGAISHIEMPLKNIQLEFFKPSDGGQWIQEILKDYLGVELETSRENRRGGYTRWEYVETLEGKEMSPKLVKTRGRHYIFPREKFVSEGDKSFSENPQAEKERVEFDAVLEGKTPF
jgi:hypothetical protein